ncbi:unnamed protein product [marine sediment metagenome]|uniref:Uncharacterized protein n=1 Tax=marine sediment metagenome TaxID=412755 RepID=X0W5M5_9ZZZZ
MKPYLTQSTCLRQPVRLPKGNLITKKPEARLIPSVALRFTLGSSKSGFEADENDSKTVGWHGQAKRRHVSLERLKHSGWHGSALCGPVVGMFEPGPL